jgi:hypothetical protein
MDQICGPLIKIQKANNFINMSALGRQPTCLPSAKSGRLAISSMVVRRDRESRLESVDAFVAKRRAPSIEATQPLEPKYEGRVRYRVPEDHS